MKKVLMSVMCIFMVMITVFSSTTIAFAGTKKTPIVMVHGMGSFGLYENPNTEFERSVGEFDVDNLVSNNFGLIKNMLRAAVDAKVDTDTVMEQVKNIVEPFNEIACDSNGNSIGNIGINSYWEDSLANHEGWLTCMTNNEPAIYRQVCDAYGAKNVYAFNYDWRLDAVDNADKLNKFIDMVKEKKKADKVILVGMSEGTVVASAYVDKYAKKNDLAKLVLLDGAFYGVGVTKAFKQDLYINKKVIEEYARQFCLTYNSKDLNTDNFTYLVAALSGAIANLSGYLNSIVKDEKTLNKIYNEVLAPVGTLPIFWEFIPYNDFNKAVSQMTKIGFLDKNTGLYKKITNYHKIQGRVAKNLKKLKKKGVQVAIIANYGTPGIPITSAYKNQTDILIDTKYASGGATVANYGKKLKKKGKYVSKDKIIDASTCILPKNTWFVKSIQHMNYWYDTEACEFLADIITTKKALNITTIKKAYGYQQFIGTNDDQKIVSVTKCGVDNM